MCKNLCYSFFFLTNMVCTFPIVDVRERLHPVEIKRRLRRSSYAVNASMFRPTCCVMHSFQFIPTYMIILLIHG